ncbi:MAG: hypothetical protein AABW79_03945 [Nanoarchaeota archaeon]
MPRGNNHGDPRHPLHFSNLAYDAESGNYVVPESIYAGRDPIGERPLGELLEEGVVDLVALADERHQPEKAPDAVGKIIRR